MMMMYLILALLNVLKLNEYIIVYVALLVQLLKPKIADENFMHRYIFFPTLTHSNTHIEILHTQNISF